MTPREVLKEIQKMGLPGVNNVDDVLQLIINLVDDSYPFIECVEAVGGYEDGPKQSYRVVKYKDKFYKFTFEHDSWAGGDYSARNFKEVVPAEKLITVYEYVK